jgi:hypothetical protein
MTHEINTVYYKSTRANKDMNKFIIIEYKDNKYVVMLAQNKYYFVFDYDKLDKVLNFNGTWNKGNGYITSKGIYLHNYIHDYKPDGKGQLFSYDHLNRI